MSGTKLSSLAGASPLSLSDLFYAVQTPGVGGTKATLAQLETLFSASFLGLSGGTLTGSLTLGGNISAAAWTTAGIKLKGGGSTLTDTTSSGTVALAVTNKLGGNTIAASSATTYTDYGTLYLDVPAAGTNVTITNPWSLIASGAMKSTALTLTGGTLTLNGATSGASVLSAPAVAGSATITLPGVTSTLATLDANTFTSLQTITVGAANTGVLASTGYSLTGSDTTSMVNLAGTWNTSGTPTAIKLNITDTASNSASLLMDLQVGSASKFRITKAGYIQFIAGSSSPSMGPVGTSLTSLGVFNAALSDYADLWTSSNYVKGALSVNDHLSIGTTHGTDGDTRLYRDAAYALAQRNGANAQTLRVYNTYTDASNYERGVFDWTTNANTLTIGTQKGGTGSIRPISFVIGGTQVAYFTTSSVTLNGDIGIGSGNQIQWTSKGKIYATSDGSFVMWDSSQTTFGQLKFGGTTSSFPALKRSSTSLQVRLADDSADAPISASYVKTPGVTVASLPSASTAGAGSRSFVTDATATTFATTVAGGGANKVPVVSDGANWIIG